MWPSLSSSSTYTCRCMWAESSLSFFFFSSRRRHTRYWRDWSSDVCSSDLLERLVLHDPAPEVHPHRQRRLRPLLVGAERLALVVIADPHARGQRRLETDEPGVGEVVGGTRLAPDRPLLGTGLFRRSSLHHAPH